MIRDLKKKKKKRILFYLALLYCGTQSTSDQASDKRHVNKTVVNIVLMKIISDFMARGFGGFWFPPKRFLL
jgi:hypothetical protein